MSLRAWFPGWSGRRRGASSGPPADAPKPPTSGLRQPAVQTGLAVVTLVIIGVLDHLTSVELWISPLYVIPIASVAWSVGFNAAYALGIASALFWATSSYSAGMRFSSPWYIYANIGLQVVTYGAVARVIAEHRALFDREQQRAHIDGLTGLLNLRALQKRADEERARLLRGGLPLTVVYLDLDGFKRVNDTAGHAAGDEVLQIVGRVLKRLVRKVDVPARIGGDEYVVLLCGTGEAAALAVLERVRDSIAQTMSERGWPVTASIGAVVYSGGSAPTVQQMLATADAQMYRAKRGGRNRIELVSIPGPVQPDSLAAVTPEEPATLGTGLKSGA